MPDHFGGRAQAVGRRRLDGSYGDDAAKVNDLVFKNFSLQRLLEVLNSSVVGHADEDDFR